MSVLGATFPITAFERSRWRGGRYACWYLQIALSCDGMDDLIRVRPILVTSVKSVD